MVHNVPELLRWSEDRHGTMSEGRDGWLRGRGDGAAEVVPVELFFDLVYVLAITQLTHHVLTHLTLRGVGQTLLLLLAVWWAWVDTAWFTNFFDPRERPVRLLLLAVMLVSLVMSATLLDAFGSRGAAFAMALAAMHVGLSCFAVAALGAQPEMRRNFQRILTWRAGSSLLWLAGGLAPGAAREAFWLAAALADLASAAMGFLTPGLGRSETTDWAIAGGHLAERCRLFVILALGESILVTGATFGELPGSVATVTAFVVAFIGSVTLWWLYFDRADEAGRRVISGSSDPGRLGRSAYTYFHIPIVAGIIATAAADNLLIAHPAREVTVATAALILGGPACYLIGNTLFKWALAGYVPRTRLVAIGALVMLVPLAAALSIMSLTIAATLVLVALALWDAARSGRAHPARSAAPARG